MMKSIILAVSAAGAALALAAANGATAQPASDGAALFDARCKMCHEGGSAPSKAALATHTSAQIVDILTNGVMAPMAAGLSEADKRAIAAHITAGAAPTSPAPAPPQTTADGAAVFDARCKLCHEGGSAPSKSVLAAHTPAQIVDILTNGVMAPMAAGLSDGEKRAVAAYITAGAAPAPPTAPTAPAAAPTTPATPTP